MNILILGNHCDPGGVTRYMINLARGLAARGNRTVIASGGGSWKPLIERAGVRHITIPIRTKSIASPRIAISLLRLRRVLRDEKIEIVHANTRVTQCLAQYIRFFFRIPYVSAFHGFYRPTGVRRTIRLWGNKIITVSDAVKRHVVRDFGAPETAVSVVYNGIPLADFQKKSKTKADYGFLPGHVILGVLGRISQEKGQFLALEAFKQLCQNNKDLFLIFSGKGKLQERLREEIARAHLTERVRFLDAPASDFLDIVDVLLVPSRLEGFGYAAIEAFAKGVPVVGFNVGGIAEIIRHRRNGILFYEYSSGALAQAIESLLADRSLSTALSTQAAEDVKQFSIDVMAENTEKVYREVLACVTA